MTPRTGYRVERLSRARLALAAGQEMARRRHLMFALVEADLTVPLGAMDAYREETGERLSLSGYVATCLARALVEHPRLNAYRKGRSLVLLDDVVVVVLLERTIDGQSAVEYLPLRAADRRTLIEVTREIRAEQAAPPRVVPGKEWVERLPVALVPVVLGWASRSIEWGLRYGVAGVNNVGFGGDVAGWGLAPGAGTLAVTVGGITRRPAADGTERRLVHLTLAFDHDVVDGAPAARFTSTLLDLLASGVTTGLTG